MQFLQERFAGFNGPRESGPRIIHIAKRRLFFRPDSSRSAGLCPLSKASSRKQVAFAESIADFRCSVLLDDVHFACRMTLENWLACRFGPSREHRSAPALCCWQVHILSRRS